MDMEPALTEYGQVHFPQGMPRSRLSPPHCAVGRGNQVLECQGQCLLLGGAVWNPQIHEMGSKALKGKVSYRGTSQR